MIDPNPQCPPPQHRSNSASAGAEYSSNTCQSDKCNRKTTIAAKHENELETVTVLTELNNHKSSSPIGEQFVEQDVVKLRRKKLLDDNYRQSQDGKKRNKRQTINDHKISNYSTPPRLSDQQQQDFAQHHLQTSDSHFHGQYRSPLDSELGPNEYCWHTTSTGAAEAGSDAHHLQQQQQPHHWTGAVDRKETFEQQLHLTGSYTPQPVPPNSLAHYPTSGDCQVNEDERASSASSSLKQQQQAQNNNNNNSSSSNNASSSSGPTAGNEYNQLRILEMRKEKSRDAARSRRSKENHEFYELAKLLPLPAAITSQLDFLDKASIIRLTISFLKLRQFSVNGHPPWAPDFTTLGSINPYSSQSLTNYAEHYSGNDSGLGQQDDSQLRNSSSVGYKQQTNPSTSANNQYSAGIAGGHHDSSSQKIVGHPLNVSALTTSLPPSSAAFSSINSYQQSHSQATNYPRNDTSLMNDKTNHAKSAASLFDIHQGTHILQSLDGFAFAIGRDGRFLYISETVSMYLGLSQVEMTGASVFDYTHQQDHEELAAQLGISYTTTADSSQEQNATNSSESPPPTSVHSQYSAASNETQIEDYVNPSCPRKRSKTTFSAARGAYGRANNKRMAQGCNKSIKVEAQTSNVISSESPAGETDDMTSGNNSSKDCRLSAMAADSVDGSQEDTLVRQFCIRMKSTLTKRGCQHFKSSGYRVVHVVAHLRSYQSNDHGHLMDPLDEAGLVPQGNSLKHSKRRGPKSTKETVSKDSIKSSNDILISDINAQGVDRKTTSKPPKIIGMVAVAIALPPPSINELRLESDTFVLRLGLDLRITHIEPKITELLHYPIELVSGRSLYSLVHPSDVEQVQKCHKDLLKKGQMMSGYYRLLARNGGYIWIQTCATLICNNTLGSGGQANILPSSPMPPTSNISMQLSHTPDQLPPHHHQQQHQHHHHSQQHLHHSKPLSYLTPTPIQVGDQMNQYNAQQHHSKIASPGLSSSHLSSNYDNQEQDQCVIFVNYMITNIVDNEEILDVCQSSNHIPLSSTFSGNNNNSNNNNNTSFKNNNILFNSPSSSCSSPCPGSLKSSVGCGSYASPSTPTTSVNLTSPRRHHGPEPKARTSADLKSTNGRRASSKSKGHSVYLPNTVPASDENGIVNHTSGFNVMEQAVKVDSSGQYEPSPADNSSNQASIYGGYSSTATGSVNLALNKAHTGDTSWLSQTQAGSVGPSGVYAPTVGGHSQVVPVTATADHYSTINRSIYKAAFGLDVSGANYSHHHHPHQQQVTYSAATNATANYATPVAANTWDTTSAAVAAVAAASNHLTNHHHGTGNPYAHLESHHHPSQGAHNLGSATTNHHHQTAAGSYYNYYGYYGNKFI